MYKDNEKQKEHYRKYYKNNKDKFYLKAKLRRQEIIKWVQELKETDPCMDCNTKYPYYVMDYDHRDGKKERVSVLARSGATKKTILKEIDKCDLVCSNCHRKRTQKRLRNKC